MVFMMIKELHDGASESRSSLKETAIKNRLTKSVESYYHDLLNIETRVISTKNDLRVLRKLNHE